jgi:hypothetical protein
MCRTSRKSGALTYRISHGPVQPCSGTALLTLYILKEGSYFDYSGNKMEEDKSWIKVYEIIKDILRNREILK